jgi:hypothetical protein
VNGHFGLLVAVGALVSLGIAAFILLLVTGVT